MMSVLSVLLGTLSHQFLNHFSCLRWRVGRRAPRGTMTGIVNKQPDCLAVVAIHCPNPSQTTDNSSPRYRGPLGMVASEAPGTEE